MRDKLIELIGKFCGGFSVADIMPPYGYENLADYLLAHGVTVQEWVSVEERLPKMWERAIVWTEYGEMGETQYDGEHFSWAYDDDFAAATHWMPLPAPPKEE